MGSDGDEAHCSCWLEGSLSLSLSLNFWTELVVYLIGFNSVLVVVLADWQIYLVLLGLFLASVVAFYMFFENSDSFWNFPIAGEQQAAARPDIETVVGDDQFGMLDLDYVEL